MSDLISRQEAVDVVRKWFDKIEQNGDICIDGIISLPSAEPRWIPVKEKLPKDNVPVNITWINRHPEPYYKSIKDVPFTATGVYFRGKWYWYSSTVEDYLAEYGRAEWDEIEEEMAGCIEVTAWMPLPEAYEDADHFTDSSKMADNWRQLRETIRELASWGGDGTQEDVCRYLLRYMEILEEKTDDTE